MNKELIKKYFKEFRHWLNGGKIISKYTLTPTWNDCQSEEIWRIPDKNISKVLIVINDEYATYRKALAEGKIIEVAVDHNEKDGYIWKRAEDDEFHYFPLDEIRIKPDVSKFKVGDWVVHNGVIKQVTKAVDGLIDSLDNQVAVIMKDESLELWEPKEGEWCIMYDMGEYQDANSVTLRRWNNKSKWKPIPFIGNLPPYIKK